MKKILFTALFLLFILSCKEKSTEGSSTEPKGEELAITEKIAYANGLKEFEEVNKLNYTFNVKRNDSLVTSRSWSWKPQVDSVTYSEGNTSLSYNYVEDAKAHPEIDQKFINDQYWLLFPFHLVWDEMEYEHNPKATAPISGKDLQQLTVTYPGDVGYTPGDVYEIYFDDDYRIQEGVYIPGVDMEKAFAATWEDYKDLNGISIASSHTNKDGSFELFFTDISVE